MSNEEGASLFGRWANEYDAIYAARGRDIIAEARAIQCILTEHGRRVGDMLDVGCGTGVHLAALADSAGEMVGVDNCREMLAIARRNAPRARLVDADMLELDLGRSFDSVISLFAVLNLTPHEEMERAFGALSAHLAPGGTLLIEPSVMLEDLVPPTEDEVEGDASGVRFWRRTSGRIEGDTLIVRFEMRFERAHGTEHIDEVHRIALRPRAWYRKQMERHGLEWEFRRVAPFPHELLVGKRPG
ncbi:MAG: class I SAM-dependent DNA methyltransferase [Phycisphaerales bacterium JB043]